MEIQFYKEPGAAWNTFVNCHRDSTNYHQYGWRDVIEKSFGHQTYYLAARDNKNEICGVVPLVYMKSAFFGKFMVSLPFFNYGGILCNTEEAESILLDEINRMRRNLQAEYMEFRHLTAPLKNLETKEHKVTMILDLQNDEDLQWKVLDPKVRNQVRKAEKNGLKVITGDFDLIDGFYEVFCRNMRDLGTPVYSRNFFQNILETFPDTTRIISVLLDGQTIASGLMTWFRDTLEVPWASSINDFKEKCPNNLLYWEAIRFAVRNGSTRFDFGRSTPGEGTFRFKKQWGAQPVQLYWQYLLKEGKKLPELNPDNPKYRLAIKAWQKLPVSLTKMLGPGIVKNIP
ncbi:MAG: FemAB family PEP-CTERM system-associated protein [Proteobacteria bacterium]|nr:FemAB family PEP-CTERM system-associated protein [Pseudomonadota bacterium]